MTTSPGRPARQCRSKSSVRMRTSAARDCSTPGGYLHLYSRESPCSKRKGKKKYEWKRDKATALQEKGRERDIHRVEKAKIHKKPSQQSNGVRLGPSSGRKASSQAFNKQRHSSSFRNCNAHTHRC